MKKREIKFRAWDGETMMFFDFNTRMKVIVSDLYEKGQVMQFTGMTDKNGKEVYEGDIVSRMCSDEQCGVDHVGEVFFNIHWGDYQIREKGVDILRELGDYHPPLAFGNMGNGILYPIEVVGNIYESQ